MNKNRITLITLGVRDLPRATKFYQDLGWVAEEMVPQIWPKILQPKQKLMKPLHWQLQLVQLNAKRLKKSFGVDLLAHLPIQKDIFGNLP